MERPGEEIRRRRIRRAEKQKEVIVCRPRPMLPPPFREVNLAAIAIDLNIRLRSADMPDVMQDRAFRCTRALLDSNSDQKNPSPTHLAMALKKEFDSRYGPAWHCIVGKSFGSFVTHSSGGFVYYSVEKLSFLLFKTQVRPIKNR
ncbi:hypothetical protein F8388_020615 [Cannabis sativa]|uniref:Dynein light chain n=1 Tax=Cannabis sativa TaxID=3483 RepID=A0A7J6F2I9_CANSA|nr:hypothetical protein F8388_020615 [Cannabis sativa]